MPRMMKWFSVLALGLISCGSQGKVVNTENPYMAVAKKDGDRPLAPSKLTFVLVDFASTTPKDVSNYIRVEEVYEPNQGLFRNLVFPSDLSSVSSSLNVNYKITSLPQFLQTSSLIRFETRQALIEQMRVLAGARAPENAQVANGKRIIRPDDLSGALKISREHPEAFVYLFPEVVDFGQARSDLNTAGISGLDKFSKINASCSYARLKIDDGEAQASIMLMRTKRNIIDLNDLTDRHCMIGFFANNWNIPLKSAERLIFGDLPLSKGKCEYLRIFQPGEDSFRTPAEKIGCPKPITAAKPTEGVANRQPEAVVAYAKRNGIGLSSADTRNVIKAMRSMCKDYVYAAPDFKASCQHAF